MIKLDIQLFGGRGATSSQESTRPQTGFKSYWSKGINDRLKNVAVKSGSKDLITDGYSILQLNKTGLDYAKDKNLTQSIKGFEKQLNTMAKEVKEYSDAKSYITDKESYDINKDYAFSTKMIKKVKTVMGKDAKVGIAYKEVGLGSNKQQQPMMIFKNKKGEKGFLLPQRKY